MRRVELADGYADLEAQTVHRPSGVVRLSGREVGLLAWLADRPRVVVSRAELLKEVWHANPRVVTRAVDNSVQRLREKLEVDPQEPRLLVTVHGVGYRFVPWAAEDELIGRGREVERVERAVATQRLVTVVGPGGIGKSALARRVASRRRTLWVTLGAGLPARAAVEAALGAEARDDVQLRRLVTQRAELLVLDGAEEDLEGARAVGGAVDVPVLVTSRVALGGEHVERLGPLLDADAVRLIRRRAPTVIDDDVAIGLARVLAGWPLAIELCVARVGLFGARGLLHQVEGGARLGTGTRTVEEAIDWALERLGEGERSDARRLSVWPGELSVEDAAALLDGDAGRAADRVERLAEASLVRRIEADPPRFVLLDPVRAHLATGRSAAESTAAITGLVRRGVAIARQLTGQATGPLAHLAHTEARARHAVLLAAWERAETPEDLGALALALDPRLVGGSVSAWLRRLDRAVSVGAPVRQARGEARVIAGDLRGAKEDFAAVGTAEGLAWTGRVRGQEGDPAGAEEALRQAIPGLEGRLRGMAESFLGAVLARSGRADEALGALRRASALLRKTSPRNHAIVVGNLGILHLEAERFADAAQCFEEALAVHRTLGDQRNVAVVSVNLGGLHLERGDFAAAEATLTVGLDAAREVGDPRLEGGVLTNLGLAALGRGAAAEADTRLGRALEELALAEDPRVEAIAVGYRGVGRLFAGDERDALRDLAAAENAARRARDAGLQARFGGWRARAEGRETEDPRDAFDRRMVARWRRVGG